jgi:hypothetical protein
MAVYTQGPTGRFRRGEKNFFAARETLCALAG